MNHTELTENYIKNHPSVKDSVSLGLINYSKLARLIEKENNIKAFDAILIAARRYYDKIKKDKTREEKIKEILKKSKLEIKNKIIVVVVERNIQIDSLIELQKKVKKNKETIHIIYGSDSITLITSSSLLDEIKKMFSSKIILINKDLIEIILKSPEEIELTPGVIGYLYSLFSELDINVIETMSCWTDTLFVIKEKDIGKAMEMLKF